MKNDLTAVRNLLIEGMERLLNPEEGDTFNVDKAKALAQIGSVLVESAKAEVKFIEHAERAGMKLQGSSFLQNTNALGDGNGK